MRPFDSVSSIGLFVCDVVAAMVVAVDDVVVVGTACIAVVEVAVVADWHSHTMRH